MVGTSQKWPAKAGGRSPKGPAVAGTTVVSKQECPLIPGVLPALVAVNILCKSGADNAAVC